MAACFHRIPKNVHNRYIEMNFRASYLLPCSSCTIIHSRTISQLSRHIFQSYANPLNERRDHDGWQTEKRKHLQCLYDQQQWRRTLRDFI